MSSSTFVLVCLQALLIQNAYSQYINSFGGAGYTGLNFDTEAVSSAAAGLSGYTNNNGLINGLGLGYGSAGLIGAGLGNGLGINNIGVNGLGCGGTGLIGAGLGNGLGINNIGVNGLGLGNGLALGGIGYGAGVSNVGASAAVPVTGPFVSNGYAELAVGGEFGVGGQAVVGGQIPVIGAVSFSGPIPASGVVSIAGNCGCASVPL